MTRIEAKQFVQRLNSKFHPSLDDDERERWINSLASDDLTGMMGALADYLQAGTRVFPTLPQLRGLVRPTEIQPVAPDSPSKRLSPTARDDARVGIAAARAALRKDKP